MSLAEAKKSSELKQMQQEKEKDVRAGLQLEEMKIRRMNAEARLLNARVRAKRLGDNENYPNEMKAVPQPRKDIDDFVFRKFQMIERLEDYIQEEKERLLNIMSGSKREPDFSKDSPKSLEIGDRYLKKYYFRLLTKAVSNVKLLPEPTCKRKAQNCAL